jgi:hypothetical protein
MHFDGNRWSVPPQLKDTTVMVRGHEIEDAFDALGEESFRPNCQS